MARMATEASSRRSARLATPDPLAIARDAVDAVGTHAVATGPAGDAVTAAIHRENVVAPGVAAQDVSRTAAREAVVPGVAVHDVHARSAVERVGSRPPVDAV